MSASSNHPLPDTIKRDTEKMVFCMLSDSEQHGEGGLKPIRKLAFDADGPIDRTNVPESLILDLLYSDELRGRA